MLYHETSPDHPQVVAWLARMQRSFDLRRVDRIILDTAGTREGRKVENLLVFEFVPRPGSPVTTPTIAGRGLLTGRLLR